MELEILIKRLTPRSAWTFGGGTVDHEVPWPCCTSLGTCAQPSPPLPCRTPKKHVPRCPQLLIVKRRCWQPLSSSSKPPRKGPRADGAPYSPTSHFVTASASQRCSPCGLRTVLLQIFTELVLVSLPSLPSLCCLFPFIVFKNPELPPPSSPAEQLPL